MASPRPFAARAFRRCVRRSTDRGSPPSVAVTLDVRHVIAAHPTRAGSRGRAVVPCLAFQPARDGEADLCEVPAGLPRSAEEAQRIRDCYKVMPRRTRYVLALRLGLGLHRHTRFVMPPSHWRCIPRASQAPSLRARCAGACGERRAEGDENGPPFRHHRGAAADELAPRRQIISSPRSDLCAPLAGGAQTSDTLPTC
jgi:hypothetical protein